MLHYLDNAQMKQLEKVMEQTLFHYELTAIDNRDEIDDSNELIEKFIAAKQVEGYSEKTLKYYQSISVNWMAIYQLVVDIYKFPKLFCIGPLMVLAYYIYLI